MAAADAVKSSRCLKLLERSLFPLAVEVCESAELPTTAEGAQSPNVEEPEPRTAAKYKGREFLHSYTLAPYVNDSEVLRYLVDIGVDLSAIELKPSIGDLLVKLDWKNDVSPLLQFLLKAGVPFDQLGAYITRNPWILQQRLPDLAKRLEYLKSKRFDDDQIARIVSKARYWLNFDVQLVDGRLGWYQRQFGLTGDEVRAIVLAHPKLVTFGTGYVQIMILTFTDVGFAKDEVKQLLLSEPKLFTCFKSIVQKSFNYLHNTIGFSHQTMLAWPRCLREPKYKIKARHEFLAHLKRDQYDKCKPNYVSLEALLSGSDDEFCQRVAKCPLRAYDEFLKLQ